jgi:hypothetical protein
MADPILDRNLELRWLDASLAAALRPATLQERRRSLEDLLRRDLTGADARSKTRTALVRIWIDPPERARAMLRWALDGYDAGLDTRVLHVGAMLATSAFFGGVCATIGRELSLHEEVDTRTVRRHLRGRYGERSTVDRAVSRAVRTLRAIGVLTGELGSTTSAAADRIVVPMSHGRWLAHAVMLSRGRREMDAREIAAAPELFMFRLPPLANDYPLIERFREGVDRDVLVERAAPSSQQQQLAIP